MSVFFFSFSSFMLCKVLWMNIKSAFRTDTVAKSLSGESSSTNYVTCKCHMLASIPMTLGMTYRICGVLMLKSCLN